MELLKLHELSRQWFYVGFICDGGCESTVLAIKSLGFVIKDTVLGQFQKGLCESARTGC